MNAAMKAEIRALLAQGAAAKLSQREVTKAFARAPNPAECMAHVRKWTPDCQYVHALLLRALRPHMGGAGRVLDLGAGNGRLAKLILADYAEAHVTLVDVGAGFLDVATDALASFPGRFAVVQGDFFDDSLSFPPGSFDCIVSSFAICHGRGDAAYQGLYKRIHDWLAPHGCFICLDHVHGATMETTELGLEDWGDILAAHFGAQGACEIIKNTLSEDAPIAVGRHLSLLAEVGFGAVDVLWKKNVFALYGGFKYA